VRYFVRTLLGLGLVVLGATVTEFEANRAGTRVRLR
jgi:hypothetical protein